MMKTLCLAMTLYSARMIAYGLTYNIPAYPFIAFGALEFNLNLFFVYVISYSSVIAPQSFNATAISIGSAMRWIFCLGLGFILAGLLVEKYSIQTMFFVVGVAGMCFFLFYLMLYQLVIQRFEINQNQESQEHDTHQQTEENCDENV